MFSKCNYTLWFILCPVLAMLILTPFTPQLDMDIARHFYREGKFQTETLQFLFDFGPWLANITGFIALFVFFASFFKKGLVKFQKPTLVIALTLIVGSLIIVNGLFKEYWGRPRPRQVVEFGGNQAFRPFYEPNFQSPEPSKAFPCGHCSTGFFFLIFGLLGLRYRHKGLAILGFGFGLFYGALLGYMRMLQGGHFFSDVLMSGLIMWLVALVIDRLVYGPLEEAT